MATLVGLGRPVANIVQNQGSAGVISDVNAAKHTSRTMRSERQQST
jgi:hypothetical protein